MVGSDLTRLSPATLSLLTNREALAIHNDPYGLQPIKVDEPTPGIQIWGEPLAIAGRCAIGILNRTDASTQVKIDWEKFGLKVTPKSLRDVRNGQKVETANDTVSVPAHDLALMIVDGDDKSPQEYSANGDSITGIKADLCATPIRKHLRSCRRGPGQKRIRAVYRDRSAIHCRIRDWHNWSYSAPRNSRPLDRWPTDSDPDAGCLCLVMSEGERTRTTETGSFGGSSQDSS